MELFRALLALLFFIWGIGLIISGIIDQNWFLFLVAAGAFLTAHIVWPSKKRGQRDEQNAWLDILEIVIDFPIDIIMWSFRLFIRLFKNSDSL